MESAVATLLQRLVEGPAVLLLGQALDDPGIPIPQPESLGSDGAAAYAEYDRLVAVQPLPEWLRDAADSPWNGVFTSRIDSGLLGVFRREWRRVAPTAQAQIGRHPRSTTQLQLRHLFGGLELPEDEQPPVGPIAAAEARAQAAETLTALADAIITPRGVLVIDGYTASDWLRPEALFACATRLQAHQAHLFSATDYLLADPYIRAAQERGVLIAHSESFAEVLSELEETGGLQRSSVGRGAQGGRFMPVGDTFAEIDIDTWNRVIGAARPVDTALLEPFASASSAMRYVESDRGRTPHGRHTRVEPANGASRAIPPSVLWHATASRPGHEPLQPDKSGASRPSRSLNKRGSPAEVATGSVESCKRTNRRSDRRGYINRHRHPHYALPTLQLSGF